MTPRRQNEKAGYATCEKLDYDDVRGKRTNIVNPDTGKLANKTIVSVETPTWFKSAFESNRQLFEQQGIDQKLGGGTPRGEVAAGGYVRKGTTPKKGAVKIEDTGVIRNQTIVSTRAPAWFKSAFESNRDYFESQGVAQQLKAPPRGTGETAAGFADEPVRMKRTNITDPDTGKLINASIVSAGAPTWFKNAFENNREYFEQKGVAEQLKKPQAGAQTNAAGHGKSSPRMKKSNIADPTTGKIYNKTIISKDAPEHFKTAFENNRPYFEKQGVAEKARDPPGKRPTSAPKQRREEHHRSREERSGTRPASAAAKSKHAGDRNGKVSSNERPRSATTPKNKSSGAEKAHSHRHTSAPGAHARASDTSSATSRQQPFQPPPRRHR